MSAFDISGPANLEKHLTFKVTRLGLRWHHPADTLLCRLLLAVVWSQINPPPSADSTAAASLDVLQNFFSVEAVDR
jgi:hypothetical protein